MSPRNLIQWMVKFRRHNTMARAAAPIIDALERRLLLTSCPSLAAGVMTVNADSVADTLLIRTVSGTIEALDGGTQGPGCAFTQNQVSQVIVNANGGNDSVTVDSSVGNIPFQLVGGDGDDTLRGHTAADTLDGEGGNDVLVGGAGSDDFMGGSGDDTADYSGTSSSLAIDIDSQADDGAGESDFVRTTIETVIGGSGNDTIRGSDGHNRIEGGGGNDVLYGDISATVTSSQGSDTLDGGSGDDTIDGMDGGDTLYDSPGLDVLYGGLNADTFYAYDEVPEEFEPDVCDTLDGGDGTDFIGTTYGEVLFSIP